LEQKTNLHCELFSRTHPYYLTIFTYGKQPHFGERFNCELLLNVITYNKYSLDYKVFGFVIMPDHLHIIYYPGKVPIYEIILKNSANYTRYYQKVRGQAFQVWADDYYLYEVKDYQTLEKIQKHIHSNPQRNCLVANLADYKYSSYGYYKDGKDEFTLLLDKVED